ncbi:hypothetical protein Rsub_07855 [Raphidocelis subcapitata]|uniref:AB hydrolase-1 domain-containing protein n=1 Tax=Raphidocelis subcapitata TaxID=307507 RepID=A0A2V0PEJ0_9CHLO|nr:hypothetical protein Rsub_07855 [Raphidocelis subcapitata]|eukprot:GBF95505.1 hypothetical protein Rsub_07855 [Raphidocelis subcapitata]
MGLPALHPLPPEAAAPPGQLPPGYRRALAALHARGVAALLLAGALLAVGCAGALLALPRAWPVWLAAEAAFLLAWLARKRRIDRVPDQHHPPDHCAVELIERFTRSVPVISRHCESYDIIGMWFRGAPAGSIKRGNVRDLLAFGFGYRTPAEYAAAGQPHVPDQILDAMERSLWGPYEDGHNPDVSFMSHLREPVRALPKPLAWYGLAEGLGGVKHAVLLAAGFRCQRWGAFAYYTLGLPPAPAAGDAAADAAGRGAAGAAAAAGSEPIFFAHGVGLGLLPYLGFVLKLAALGRPVVAIEYPHLAMRWTPHIPTVDEGVEAMLGILDAHSIPRAAFVGHSFGTFFLSRLNRVAPQRVAAMALIDPVCMCMWSGHLVKSFVYSPHANKTGTITWWIARDIHTATAVARRFYWSEYNMWPDMFPDHALVVVSGEDDLVPARHVVSMVAHETDAALMYIPGERHAAFLFNLDWQGEVVAGVAGLLERAAAGPAPRRRAAAAAAAAADAAAGERSPAAAAPRARGVAHGHSDSAFSLSLSLSPSLSPSHSSSSDLGGLVSLGPGASDGGASGSGSDAGDGGAAAAVAEVAAALMDDAPPAGGGGARSGGAAAARPRRAAQAAGGGGKSRRGSAAEFEDVRIKSA